MQQMERHGRPAEDSTLQVDFSMKKPVTVYDIARELGISPSTVSRVFNNSMLVGEETRERILRTAGEMGYRKRRIRRQQARAILDIALVLPSFTRTTLHLFYDPAELITGLEDGLSDTRVRIITTLADGRDRLFTNKKLGDLDGCVFAFTTPDPALCRNLDAREVPWVVLNRVSESFNHVSNDNAGGMRKLVRRAYSRWGAKLRPCYFGFAPIAPVSAQRREGFLAELTVCGIPPGSAHLAELGQIRALSATVLRGLRDEGYNAFFCFNDVMAVYAWQVAQSAGIAIPEEASLTGFDRSPVRDLALVAIDTVNLPVYRLGLEAGRWLKSNIIDRAQDPIRMLVEGEYVAGETLEHRD
jgi:LacI family transcriptional regulator